MAPADTPSGPSGAAGLRARTALGVNRSVFYGWVMAALAGLGYFASGPAQSHTFSVFIGPLGRDLGLSSTEISSAYGVATLAASFCLPLVGRVLDRMGPRRTGTGVAVLLGLACLLFSLVPGGIWLALGFAALRFSGQGALMLTSANLVSQWFDRKRGFALSLMALGFSLSMAVHPTLAEWLIDLVGWRQAWVWLAISTWVVLAPAFLLLAFDRPEVLGLAPDGAAPVAAGAARAEARSLTLAEALRTPTFYIIAAGLFSGSMLVTSLHFFQVSIFEHQGLSRDAATLTFSVAAVVMVVTMPVFGRMLDRFPTPPMFAIALGLMALALLLAGMVDDVSTAMIYGVVFGLNNGTNIACHSYLWPRYFGRRHLGSVQGTGQMIGVVGASLGPLPLGIAFDLTGVYAPTLFALAALPLACALFTVVLRDPRGAPFQAVGQKSE
ncbi:MAG: MFS transporter [Pseudomonadota bacterium]|nr:MFS transporter [Pseudomonadota bacterium]